MWVLTQEISIKLLTVHYTPGHVPGLPLCFMKQPYLSIQKFLYSDVMKPHKYYRCLLHRFGHLPKVLNLFIYIYLCISCIQHGVNIEVREQLSGVGSLFLSRGLWGSNSSSHARWDESPYLPTLFTGPSSVSDQNIFWHITTIGRICWLLLSYCAALELTAKQDNVSEWN